MQKVINFLAGIFSGAVVGAVAALMLTPSSGNEMRDQIQNRADNLVAELKSAVADERRRLEAELEALKRGEMQIQ
jgi:gas vesicle protein